MAWTRRTRPAADQTASKFSGRVCTSRETGYLGIRAGKEQKMFPIRYLAAAIAALTISGAAAPGGAQPHSHAAMITCTNPASGATWQISIDYDLATVDANAARLSATQISWHDAKDGGNYTLDLRSGELTVIVASSTGGYFLHDRCGLPP
jgi:hypothetical protein